MKPPCCFSSSIALYTVKIYRKHKKVRLTNALIRQSAQEKYNAHMKHYKIQIIRRFIKILIIDE